MLAINNSRRSVTVWRRRPLAGSSNDAYIPVYEGNKYLYIAH